MSNPVPSLSKDFRKCLRIGFTREDAERVLSLARVPIQSYLVRESTTFPGSFSLSVKDPVGYSNMKEGRNK